MAGGEAASLALHDVGVLSVVAGKLEHNAAALRRFCLVCRAWRDAAQGLPGISVTCTDPQQLPDLPEKYPRAKSVALSFLAKAEPFPPEAPTSLAAGRTPTLLQKDPGVHSFAEVDADLQRLRLESQAPDCTSSPDLSDERGGVAGGGQPTARQHSEGAPKEAAVALLARGGRLAPRQLELKVRVPVFLLDREAGAGGAVQALEAGVQGQGEAAVPRGPASLQSAFSFKDLTALHLHGIQLNHQNPFATLLHSLGRSPSLPAPCVLRTLCLSALLCPSCPLPPWSQQGSSSASPCGAASSPNRWSSAQQRRAMKAPSCGPSQGAAAAVEGIEGRWVGERSRHRHTQCAGSQHLLDGLVPLLASCCGGLRRLTVLHCPHLEDKHLRALIGSMLQHQGSASQKGHERNAGLGDHDAGALSDGSREGCAERRIFPAPQILLSDALLHFEGQFPAVSPSVLAELVAAFPVLHHLHFFTASLDLSQPLMASLAQHSAMLRSLAVLPMMAPPALRALPGCSQLASLDLGLDRGAWMEGREYADWRLSSTLLLEAIAAMPGLTSLAMGFSHPLASSTLLDDSFVLQLAQALGAWGPQNQGAPEPDRVAGPGELTERGPEEWQARGGELDAADGQGPGDGLSLSDAAAAAFFRRRSDSRASGDSPAPGLKHLALRSDLISSFSLPALPRACLGLRTFCIASVRVQSQALVAMSAAWRHLSSFSALGPCPVSDLGVQMLTAGCMNLRSLDLSGCSALSSIGLAALAACPALTELNLARTAVDDTSLSAIVHASRATLTWIDLSETHKLDSIHSLALCSALRVLLLEGCSAVNPQALFALCPAVPSLCHVSLHGKDAGPDGLAALAACRALRRLDLGCCLNVRGPELLDVALACSGLRLATACSCLSSCRDSSAFSLMEGNGCEIVLWQHDDLLLVHI